MHVFDRYEIHIQAFLYFINGKFIISVPHLHKNIFQIYTQICMKTRKTKNGERRKTKLQKASDETKSKHMGHMTYIFENFRIFVGPRLTKIICSQDDSINFLVFFEAFW